MRILTAVLFLVALAYGYSESRRWNEPEYRDILSKTQRRRRFVTFFALLIVLLMAFGGTFFPFSHVSKRMASVELLYWLACFLAAAVIPLVALREYRDTLKQSGLQNLATERNDAYEALVETAAEAERRADLPHRNGHG